MKFHFKSNAGDATGTVAKSGKGCGTLFFGLFFLVGMLFVVLILGEAIATAAPWLWNATDCEVIDSRVNETGDDEHPYAPGAVYTYEIEGRIHESSTFYRNFDGTSSYDRARDMAARYPAGSRATCYVSPDQPALSVLERRPPWIAFLVLFPMIFVAIGGGGLWAVWRGSGEENEGDLQSISQQATGDGGAKFMLAIGLVFAVIGSAVFVPLFGLPVTRLALSSTWRSTPCTIVSSQLRSWETDDGYSYRADVHYQYEAGGETWRSNRVDFFSIVTSGRESARAIRDRYKRGTDHTCSVDPKDPSKSVLDRRFRPIHLVGSVSLLFLLAGIALANHGRKKLQGDPQAATVFGDTEFEPDLGEGPVVLEPQMGPWKKVFGCLVFSGFWNGIVSVFALRVLKSHQSGDPDWFLTVFLIPFLLVGLGSIVFVLYFLLATANPRPKIKLLSGQPKLGDDLMIEWFFSGRANRISHLEIALEGREEATYRRGTDTITEKEIFSTKKLIDTGNDWEIARGETRVRIPDDTMHTFNGDNNKVIWELKVTGVIDRWPDVGESFPVTVGPLAKASI